jgi:hypothetical protein
MLSSVLRSRRAVRVNVEIMRAFVHLRRMLDANGDLARKLDALERKYDGQFAVVFQAIRELMTTRRPLGRLIGFRVAPEARADQRALQGVSSRRKRSPARGNG